jgi:hypothetical protein
LGGRSAFYGEKKLSFKLSGPAPRVKDRWIVTSLIFKLKDLRFYCFNFENVDVYFFSLLKDKLHLQYFRKRKELRENEKKCGQQG